jgi:hypothetical protein
MGEATLVRGCDLGDVEESFTMVEEDRDDGQVHVVDETCSQILLDR